MMAAIKAGASPIPSAVSRRQIVTSTRGRGAKNPRRFIGMMRNQRSWPGKTVYSLTFKKRAI